MKVMGRLGIAAIQLVARFLALLPGPLLSSASAQAEKIRNQWLDNPVASAYARGSVRRTLTWGSRHPVWFTCGVMLAAAVTALATVQGIGTCLNWTDLCSHVPKLEDDFDFPAFIGVPWGAQATLVGLVYPVVISFVALMLQRRAHSTTALRLYALESAVIPAGASAIGLLTLLTLQYFGALHAAEVKEALIMPMLAFDGAWFVVNLVLTAYFLTRTIRFLQEDEQSLIYTRLAIDVVLRQELAASITQQIVASAPQRLWQQPADGGRTTGAQTILWRPETIPQVEHDIAAGQVIVDVRLRLLSWVRASWLRRALRQPATPNNRQVPTLHFRLSGETIQPARIPLCGVTHGPSLNWLERLGARLAYSFGQGHGIALGLSTERMLKELALECQTHYDEGRYELATEVVLEQVALHGALLNACAFNADGVPDNAALTPSVVRWAGDHSFQWNWLSTYRDLSRRAVKLLENDDRLFRRMAYVSRQLISSVRTRPEKLLAEAQLVATHLAYELGLWWMRHAQTAMSSSSGAFTGVLPAPFGHTYDTALVQFLGAWDAIDVDVLPAARTSPSEYWLDVCARTQVYATHIDHSAKMFLDAMSRGDEVASERFCDHFLKWWGIKESELELGHLEHDPDLDFVGLSVTNTDWASLDASLPAHRYPVTPAFGANVANLGLRRYWESMRLVLVLLCLKNAGDAPSVDSRELRMATALIQRKPLKRGADVEADSLDDLDDGLTRALAIRFGDTQTERRLDAFCDRLRWEDRAPEVPGWMYSWSGGTTDVDSLTPQLVQLLTALSDSRTLSARNCVRRVERFGRDIDQLESILRFCDSVRRSVLAGGPHAALPLVQTLRTILGKKAPLSKARLSVADACKELSRVARHERLTTLRSMAVDPACVTRYAAKLSEAAFGSAAKSKLGTTPAMTLTTVGTKYEMQFRVEKRRLANSAVEPLSDDSAKHTGENVRLHADAWALADYLRRTGAIPVPSTGVERLSAATPADLAAFVASVAAACSTVRAAGKTPLVLVAPGPLSGVLSSFQWLASRGRTLPSGVDLREDSSSGTRQRFINNVLIREMHTPGGACYVVPASEAESLRVAGSSAAGVLASNWKPVGDETVLITVAWNAILGPDSAPAP